MPPDIKQLLEAALEAAYASGRADEACPCFGGRDDPAYPTAKAAETKAAETKAALLAALGL